MRALITGASAGLGREFALQLSQAGYDLVLVARRTERLAAVAAVCATRTEIVTMDVSDVENCRRLYAEHRDVDLVINNAGFGAHGLFSEISLEKELDMLKVNILSLHVLTKLYYKDFVERDKGAILNVASSAAFLPGPLMSSYYASKAYVLRLTQGLRGELSAKKSGVYVGALCPGPVDTEFNAVAGAQFAVKALSAKAVVAYTLKQMEKGKGVIVPGFMMQTSRIFAKLLPDGVLAKVAYYIQNEKQR